MDLEIDLDDEASGEDLAAAEADDGQIDEEDEDIELELDLDDELEEASPPAASAEEAEPGGAEQTVIQYSSAEATILQEAPVEEPENSGSGSSTTPQQIAEDLEEAAFYFDQGLLEEAETIYRRVVEAAPNHPQAMLRLGEIAEQRGEDPGSPGDEALAVEDDEPSGVEAASDEVAEELHDTLGDELVEWGDEDIDAAACHVSDDASDGDELELDVDLDPDDSADDTTSPELNVSAVQHEEAAADADTAVGAKPPESQPELESSADEDTVGSDAPEDEEVEEELEVELDVDDSIESEQISAAASDEEAVADDAFEEETPELETPLAEADEAAPEPVEAAEDDAAFEISLDVEEPEPEASLDVAQEGPVVDAAPEEDGALLEAAEAPAEEADSEPQEELELEPESESEALELDDPGPEAEEVFPEEPLAAASAEDVCEEQPEVEVDEEEEATFDLAAELSDVFDESEELTASPEDSDAGFEAVFREFKKGVKEQLSESDYEAHYDLGIAYREMGLLDDAVSEFRIALGSGEHKLAALHMLGLCALDQGLPRDAAAHFEQALSLPAIPAQQQAPLRYDLARAFESAGDIVRARSAYEAVVASDPDHADAAERLDALAEAAAPAQELETFESFDDLIAEAEAALSPEEEEAAADAAEAELDDEPSVLELAEGEETAAEAELAESEPEQGEAVLEAVLEAEPAEPVVEAEQTAPPAELEPEPEPEPPARKRRKKKISFL
jgi:Tfp pilus assembly protein PilF